ASCRACQQQGWSNKECQEWQSSENHAKSSKSIKSTRSRVPHTTAVKKYGGRQIPSKKITKHEKNRGILGI
ncbi:MAG TPA: hypothetical protein PKI36_05865, partial [Turneriella sp.]|nr:hypothetical protein [Turneriella sp.]